MRASSERYGSLNCRRVDWLPPGQLPQLGIVLCHGYGAPGTDLVPLAQALAQVQPSLKGRVQFLFPEAPLSLEDWGMPFGRAWWPLNLQRLQEQIAARRIDEVRAARPPGMPEAREALTAAVGAWFQETGLSWSRCVLGGFSQGAMLSVEVAVHLAERPAALTVLSGALVNEQTWRTEAARGLGPRVFQSHGRYDVILPFAMGQWLREVFADSGWPVEFHEFPGGHEIPYDVLESLGEFLGNT
uniref:Phospholipase n=1 Tax=Schlesneria paludicola TaxID=360056 RepID=A0A7C2P2L4_9PLAN